MSVTMKTERGDIRISNEAIAQIAANAAMECYGVVGMTYKSKKSGIASILKGEHQSKGIEVTEQEGGVVIDVYVIIQFGTKISVVAENIIEKVKYFVEKQTGVTVKDVQLNIEGVRVRD